jgi:hypothetical protein
MYSIAVRFSYSTVQYPSAKRGTIPFYILVLDINGNSDLALFILWPTCLRLIYFSHLHKPVYH